MAVDGDTRSKTVVWIALFSMAIAVIPVSATAKIHRSKAALRAFVNQNACPSTGLHRLPCKDYIIDHIKALACGGADNPANMQWQTCSDAKEKDKWERIGCATGSRP